MSHPRGSRRLSPHAVRTRLFLAVIASVVALAMPHPAAAGDPRYFDIGTPVVHDIWVDPVGGSNAGSGATRLEAVRTLTEAWSRVPIRTTLDTTGYRILLAAGNYAPADVPNYFESRWGTHGFPVILAAADGAGTAKLPALNIYDCRFLYLLDLHISAAGGDVLHCELCDHLLVRRTTVRGTPPTTFGVQETIKVNQSQNVFIEDSDISGAWDNALDFVAVQYGHLQGNRIHDAGDWCAYVKGGSASIRVEGNEFYDCGTGGFTAGQGTGFEFMTSPWLHYEAYDIRVVNNLVRDTRGAGLGVNGGYNILLAYNTLYRVGAISHGLEFVFGLRGCDGDTAACSSALAAGGWGTIGSTEQPVPNRNVYAYNNVLYNPAPFRSQWQHLAIYGPRTPAPTSNIPLPAHTDTGLQLRGNVFWNGPADLPLGIEDPSQGCRPSNPSCNEAQLLADNSFNTLEPAFVAPGSGNFQPLAAGNLYAATTYALPAFPSDDRPSPPLPPLGELANEVTRDFHGSPRGPGSPPGAFAADCSIAVCGDGVRAVGCEQCDDGNLVDGDGCDAGCRLDCPASPLPMCNEPGQPRGSRLVLKDAAASDRDSIRWKLVRAASTTPASIGDPLVGASYLLCAWDTQAGSPVLVLGASIPSAVDCNGSGCWAASKGGYRYVTGTPGRVELRLQPRPGGVGNVSLRSKGSPDFAIALPVAQAPSLTMQLRSSTGACWGATYSAPAGRRDAAVFKDSAD